MSNNKQEELEQFIETFLNKVFTETNENPLSKLILDLTKSLPKNEEKENSCSENNIIASIYRENSRIGINLKDDDLNILPNILLVNLKAVCEHCGKNTLNAVLTDFQEYVKNI